MADDLWRPDGRDAMDAGSEADLGADDSPSGSRNTDRVLRLLRILADNPDGITLTAAAREASLAISTTARILAALTRNGFTSRDDAGKYGAGSGLLRIGAAALNDFPLRKLAEPRLRELSELTQETAYLSIQYGPHEAVYLMQVESPQAIRHASWTGRTIQTEGSATGAALAGRVNGRGFASSTECAVEPDAAIAAAPIYDAGGRIAGALSVIGPTARIGPEALVEFGKAVATAARAVSVDLGYDANTPLVSSDE